MIRFACPTCGAKYKLDDKYAGKTSKCSKCESTVVVPINNPSAPIIPTSNVSPHQQSSASTQHKLDVSLQTTQPTGIQGFFRAFGITSGFMAAIAAVVLGIPILICSGCLVYLIDIGATTERPTGISANPESGPSDVSRAQELSFIAPTVDPIPSDEQTKENPLIETVVETVVVQTLPLIDLSERPNVFPIVDLTATVKDIYIYDIRLLELNERLVTADILFENNSGSNWTPRFEVEFVNAYGVVLGHDSVAWVSSLEPKKRYRESVDYYPSSFKRTFRYSNIQRPPDFDLPKYVVIQYP